MGEAQKRFGTISGVFIPNVLTIFGVILFYREGWVVANAGLLGAIGIILLANAITLVTAFSTSAIATNIKVKGGGAYFLISRSLGPEIGGAFGIALFFAQAFSIAFYIIGFTMALHDFFPQTPLWVLNTITLGALSLLSIFSAEIAIKVQYFIFAAVMIALISFFSGNLRFNVRPTLIGAFPQESFWKTFAIYFPAVTGIFAGLSLSGDLKTPNTSIPKGTLGAIGFTLFFYLVVALWFGFNFKPEQILGQEDIMMRSALVPALVRVGIWAATLSSAIGMLLGAPRTLQAVAVDGIMPRFLGWGSGKNNEPRVAMIFSIILAEILLLQGTIDFIAQLLTLFFLATYGMVNFIAAFEVIIGNPAYRPTYKVHWSISLLGGIGAFVVMFLIDHWAAVVAFVILLVLIVLINLVLMRTKKGTEINWGDIRKGFWASLLEIGLSNYERFEEHPRTWRPHVAIFENSKENRDLLIQFATQMVGKRGIVSNYIFRDAMLEDSANIVRQELEEMRNFLDDKGLTFVYPEVIITNKDKNAPLITLQADGIGAFKANTIISDFRLDDSSLRNHLSLLRSYSVLKKNVILLKRNQAELVSEDRIDVWISGFRSNISLMLLVPFMLTRHSEWGNSTICIRMITQNDVMKERAETNLRALLSAGRIQAEIDVRSLEMENVTGEIGIIEKPKDRVWEKVFGASRWMSRLVKVLSHLEQPRVKGKERERVREIIKTTSKDARLVVMGLDAPEPNKEAVYAADLRGLLKELPMTVLVKGNYNVNLFI